MRVDRVNFVFFICFEDNLFNMNFENEEFQFALEMIIASHNENGATLSDIRGMLATNILFLLLIKMAYRRNSI